MKTLAWKQITMALVIGFLLGGGLSLWQDHRPPWMSYSSEEKKERMLQRFSSELKLTDPQRAEVKKILDSAQEQTETFRAEVRPKFQAIRNEMSRSIRTLLTDEQRKRFEAMETEWTARKMRRTL